MIMRWNKGRPTQSGYYLVWNPSEEPFPFIMHCNVSNGMCWWTYAIHKIVLDEVVCAIAHYAKEALHCHLLDFSKNKASKEALNSVFDEMDDAENITSRSIAFDNLIYGDDMHMVYDATPPDLWMPIPTLFSLDDEDFDSALRVSPDLNSDVADLAACATNIAAQAIEKALRTAVSKASPWDNKAPWSRGLENE